MGYGLALGQTALALVLAPGVVGLIRWLKARLQNRRGAPAWQPYFELRKLFQKEVVVSRNASWLFRAAPFVIFASVVAMAALVPVLWRLRPSTRWAIWWCWSTSSSWARSSWRWRASIPAPRSAAWSEP